MSFRIGWYTTVCKTKGGEGLIIFFGFGFDSTRMLKKGGKDMVQKIFFCAIVLLSLMVFLPPVNSYSKDNIVVGTTISTTGSFTFASSQGFKGLQVWVDDVNKRGGIFVNEFNKKLPIKLVYYDDRSDKETVVRLYEKLVTDDKADICFAPFGSTLTGAAAAITENMAKC